MCQRAWEEDAEADDDIDNAPSEAFISLQKDLEEKEKIQQENADRLRNEDIKAAEAAKSLRRKVKEQVSETLDKWTTFCAQIAPEPRTKFKLL